MADSVAKVVNKCGEASESGFLDLSDCLLTQVPDAVFHLMRHTHLSKCDLSFNVMTKIPAKLATSFAAITDLNLSHNRMNKLPDEIVQLTSLLRLDISHNSFSVLPYAVFGLSRILIINAEGNQITDVEVGRLSSLESLQEVNLCDNPLTRQCRKSIEDRPKGPLTVLLSEEKLEEWEEGLGDSN